MRESKRAEQRDVFLWAVVRYYIGLVGVLNKTGSKL